MSGAASPAVAGLGGESALDERPVRAVATLSPQLIWCFITAGAVLSGLILLVPAEPTRIFLQNLLGLAAAAAAVGGMVRNRPAHAGVWRLLVVAVVLFAAADVAFDVVRASFGDDHSMLSQLVYLPAYPLLALALYRLAIGRLRRDTAIDGAIVAVAVSAAIWQWVVMPVLTSPVTATMDRVAAVAYPALDIALVVVVIHATAWLPRRMTAAWLLFAGTALILGSGTVYARIAADGSYREGGLLDAIGPFAYILLAAAVLHPSMQQLYDRRDTGARRNSRTRIVVLGIALFSAPVVVLLDDVSHGDSVALAAIVGVGAAMVLLRLAQLIAETNRARDVLAEAAELNATETRVLEMILSGAPIPETIHILLEAVEKVVESSSCSVRLCDAESGRLQHVAAPTLPVDYLRAIDELTSVDDIPSAFRAESLLVIPDISDTDVRPDLREVALAHGLHAMSTMPVRNPDGSQVIGLLSLYLRVPRAPTDAEIALLERTRDLVALVIDRAAQTQQLGYLALHDTLTGLPNRSLAVNRLEHALTRLGEHDSMVAVLFIDLDRFKVVNDGLGHDVGDELLVAASRRLTAALRQQDTVARFGGDEFVVLCEDLIDEHQAEELADRAARALTRPFGLGRAEVTVSASVGIAVTRSATYGADDLLRNADAAMYRAKRRGGAGYERFDEAMETQAATRKLTERALHQALDRHELQLLFQPQFDLRTGERVASEALLRWTHPVRGTVAPADFLRVAEETGAIVPIGEWVLDQTCAQARRSVNDGPQHSPLCVSANLSARQLLRPDFARMVASTVERHGINPETLCLEIAEATLLDDVDATHVALRALKEHGMRLAIDDFGTGGSSLTYLRQFPFDELKVDRSFIAGLGKTRADDAIVAATIDMAHALDMVVAAEGVEDEGQLVRLTELGCDRAQGFHLGRPDRLTPPELILAGTASRHAAGLTTS